MSKLADAADWLIDRVGSFTAWLTLAMVLLISGNTLSRYFFNASTVWLQELEWHLLAVVALWGIGYLQLRGTQVRVDLFYQHYSARTKLWLDFLTALLVMLPFSLFVCFLGWKFAAYSWSLAEVSPDPGGLPWRWAVKSLVVSGYALLALVAFSIVVRTGTQLAGRAPASPSPEASHGT
ncbi:TRAP transporter small permease subunit [Rubrivivax rivuli]|uniref:TRAP transporter small permease protein n=1 Tax=Rubrivivax rivuli TaxID=1862385 RepID=A0A437RRJ9_9BURK|nr:TRAP transporter small permease subunit [Rubrivivax rivuli]RVU49315.1 TRAP transporter small permease subunit [Rubrivivax rivuli]